MELRINWLWLFYSLLSWFSYGTETFLCTIVTDQMHFLVFTKFLGTFILSIILLLKYEKNFTISKTVKGFLAVLFSAFSIFLLLVLTLLGLVHAKKSGTNPGLLISLQLNSVLVAFVLGRLIFGEKASYMQYFGSFVLTGAIVTLLISRAYHEEDSVSKLEKFDPKHYWISVFSMLLGGVILGYSTWVMKYALVHYSVHEYEFSIFQWLFSAMIGMVFSIFLKPSGVSFLNFDYVWYNISVMTVVGFLAGTGGISLFLAAGRGTIQLSQVISSSYPCVQIILEAIFLSKYLTIFETIMVLLIITGASIIVIFDTEENPVGGEKIMLNIGTEKSDA